MCHHPLPLMNIWVWMVVCDSLGPPFNWMTRPWFPKNEAEWKCFGFPHLKLETPWEEAWLVPLPSFDFANPPFTSSTLFVSPIFTYKFMLLGLSFDSAIPPLAHLFLLLRYHALSVSLNFFSSRSCSFFIAAKRNSSMMLEIPFSMSFNTL